MAEFTPKFNATNDLLCLGKCKYFTSLHFTLQQAFEYEKEIVLDLSLMLGKDFVRGNERDVRRVK